MGELVSSAGVLGWVAAKTLLLFLTVVLGLRIAVRRTLADLSVVDFVVAVGIGAVVGRIPNANDTSYLEGVVTVVTLLVVHAALTRLRYIPGVAALVDHPLRLLVVRGVVDDRALRQSGLTRSDLFALLRRHDVHELSELRCLVLEQAGNFSVVREQGQPPDADGGILSFFSG